MDTVKLVKKANELAKKYKVISRGLDKLGAKRTAGLARAVGYGKKRRKGRRRKRKTQHGGSFLGKLLGSVASVPAGALIGGIGGTIGALRGLGKKKRRPRGAQRGGRRVNFRTLNPGFANRNLIM